MAWGRRAPRVRVPRSGIRLVAPNEHSLARACRAGRNRGDGSRAGRRRGNAAWGAEPGGRGAGYSSRNGFALSPRSTFFSTLPVALRGSGSRRISKWAGTLKAASVAPTQAASVGGSGSRARASGRRSPSPPGRAPRGRRRPPPPPRPPGAPRGAARSRPGRCSRRRAGSGRARASRRRGGRRRACRRRPCGASGRRRSSPPSPRGLRQYSSIRSGPRRWISPSSPSGSGASRRRRGSRASTVGSGRPTEVEVRASSSPPIDRRERAGLREPVAEADAAPRAREARAHPRLEAGLHRRAARADLQDAREVVAPALGMVHDAVGHRAHRPPARDPLALDEAHHLDRIEAAGRQHRLRAHREHHDRAGVEPRDVEERRRHERARRVRGPLGAAVAPVVRSRRRASMRRGAPLKNRALTSRGCRGGSDRALRAPVVPLVYRIRRGRPRRSGRRAAPRRGASEECGEVPLDLDHRQPGSARAEAREALAVADQRPSGRSQPRP